MYVELANEFGNYVELTETELTTILSKFKPITVVKNEVLLAKGSVSRYLYFVQKGCLRSFYLQDNGQEATRLIAFEQTFCSALSSFITQKPTNEYLQALEDSHLLMIHKSDFDALLAEICSFERFYRQRLENAQVVNTWRLESLLSMTAKKRYEHLLQYEPRIIQRLPNKIVASYLGITQESLSRLKAGK
jgi:CRP-like cAMP-binding protein